MSVCIPFEFSSKRACHPKIKILIPLQTRLAGSHLVLNIRPFPIYLISLYHLNCHENISCSQVLKSLSHLPYCEYFVIWGADEVIDKMIITCLGQKSHVKFQDNIYININNLSITFHHFKLTACLRQSIYITYLEKWLVNCQGTLQLYTNIYFFIDIHIIADKILRLARPTYTF